MANMEKWNASRTDQPKLKNMTLKREDHWRSHSLSSRILFQSLIKEVTKELRQTSKHLKYWTRTCDIMCLHFSRTIQYSSLLKENIDHLAHPSPFPVSRQPDLKSAQPYVGIYSLWHHLWDLKAAETFNTRGFNMHGVHKNRKPIKSS